MAPFVQVAWPSATGSFPVVEATATFNIEEQGTNMFITLPTGITAGDLLLMFCNTPESSGSSVPVVPTGWSTLYGTPFDGKAINTCAAFYKTATGSEGATVEMELIWSRLTAATYRISGWQGTPEYATFTKANSTAPDPGSLSPSWGSDKNLWLAVAQSSAATTVTYPSGYSGGISAYTGAGNNYHSRTSVAQLGLEAASENPGAFTLGEAQPWVATTVAVRGAA